MKIFSSREEKENGSRQGREARQDFFQLFFILWFFLCALLWGLCGFARAIPEESFFPHPWVWAQAAENLTRARSLYSDYPELYRITWSAALAGPCPHELVGPGGEDDKWGVPCTTEPFLPEPRGPQLPSVLYLASQQLVYTAPEDLAHPKASLALAWKFSLISAGIQWDLTVTSKGIQHDLFLCEYEKFTIPLQILPLVFIDVEMLRPRRYHHVEVTPTGQYNVETHHMRDWRLPMSALSVGLLYDVLPDLPHCGTHALAYTTRPSEALMDVLGGLVGDIPNLVPGDAQWLATPQLGFQPCGEYPYPAFHQFMLHRDTPTPSNQRDGPPLETWSFSGERDRGESTRAATDSDHTADHSHVAEVQGDLQALGFEGDWNRDSHMGERIAEQKRDHAGQFQRGRDLGDLALSLMNTLIQNPDNPHLLELFQQFIEPHLPHIDHVNDSEIEFNPFLPHCTPDPMPGTLPILGAHFFDPPPEHCGFCVYHDLILERPLLSWGHTRLLEMRWYWEPIHGSSGNLYEQAIGFIQAVLAEKTNLTNLHDTLYDRQAQATLQGGDLTLAELEATPSDLTDNTASSAPSDDLPGLLTAPYDPCMDPSWTIQYLLLFGEILDIFGAPCGWLWAVTPP